VGARTGKPGIGRPAQIRPLPWVVGKVGLHGRPEPTSAGFCRTGLFAAPPASAMKSTNGRNTQMNGEAALTRCGSGPRVCKGVETPCDPKLTSSHFRKFIETLKEYSHA